ncbi:MAG: hypothetical protein ACOYIT_03195 [Christensenellales bacterium]|jgi:hypothetical protein
MPFELYRMPPRKKLYRAVFVNPQREDEEKIFKSAISKLKTVPEITLTTIQTEPYSDYVEGKCPEGDFYIFLDADYGADIRAKSEKALDYVSSILTR